MDHEPERSALEEAFAAWLAPYQDEQLGGMLTCHFLTREHLMAAFAAGYGARPVPARAGGAAR